ncbi:MAG: type II toxin-antitoxin system Phd/YefM family antitoxin [Xenococcaceae cyanobacterium MO_167.B52]|nr:type II toxin-antitoxin system Phd/YefM family antitoxin [Xenococcaceae cyanobacterium MO_167.B52]
MPKYLTIAEAQQQLAELSNQLTDEPAIITKDGKPVMITFSLEQFESLIETIEIISDRELMTELKQGIKQYKSKQNIKTAFD